MNNTHHWSGWPGAYCMKCLAEDPLEIALVDGDYDPERDEWKSDEKREAFIKANVCSVEGKLVYNTKTEQWDLHKDIKDENSV